MHVNEDAEPSIEKVILVVPGQNEIQVLVKDELGKRATCSDLVEEYEYKLGQDTNLIIEHCL